MLHSRNDWLIPNIFHQEEAGGGGGGDDDKKLPDESEDLILTDKLFELEMEELDSLLDNENIDIEKLTEWMKLRDENSTIESILIVDEKDDNKKKDQDEDLTDDQKAAAKAAAEKVDEDLDEDAKQKLADAKEKRDQSKADDKKLDDKKADDEAAGKTDDESKADDKTKAKVIKITDEYIKTQEQNFRKQYKDEDPEVVDKKTEYFRDILNGIKGGEMDSKALKNYINAQMYIKTIKSPFDADWKPDEKVVSTPEYIKEATNQKHKIIAEQMHAKYPDMPADAFEDDEVLKQWEEGLSRREYDSYNHFHKEVEGNINKQYDRYTHVVTNWETIAKDTITADVKLFEARLSKLNLTLKDLGIETLDLNETDLYNEYLWKNIIFVDGKTDNPDANIMTFMDDTIPIIRPGSVYAKLIDSNLEKLLGKAGHDGRKQGFKAGMNNQEDPSTSENVGLKHRENLEITEESFDDDDLTPAQMEEKLARLKTAIIAGTGATIKKRK